MPTQTDTEPVTDASLAAAKQITGAGACEPQPAEIVQLETTVKDSGVELATAQGLIESFAPIFRTVHDLLEKAKSAPNVQDATQLKEMEANRKLRLALVKQRTTGEKLKDRLKADSIMRGKAIQGVYNLLEFMVKPIEAHLEEREKFAERAQAARLAALKQECEDAARPYLRPGIDPASFNLHLLPEAERNVFIADMKVAHEDRLAREAKEAAEAAEKAKQEAERLAKAEAEAKETARLLKIEKALSDMGKHIADLVSCCEHDGVASVIKTVESIRMNPDCFQERLAEAQSIQTDALVRLGAMLAQEQALAAERAENERKLAKERAEAAAAARAAQDRADAEAKRIRDEAAEKEAALKARMLADAEARDRAESELAAQRKREADATAAKLAAERAAAAAPDKQKLIVLAATIRDMELPVLDASREALSQKLREQIAKFAAWIAFEAGKL